jgi:tetratricopeptide (TPR) repeat protein
VTAIISSSIIPTHYLFYSILYTINTNMFLSLIGSGLKPQKFLFFLLILLITPAIYAQNSDIEFILSEAAAKLQNREFTPALELFNRLKPEDAQNTSILLMRASILNAAGRPAEARQIANGILAKEADNTDALMIIADAAAREGKDRERRTTLERVIRINPTHARALTDLGNISLGNRNLRVAASYFDRVLAVEPDNGEALVSRATVHRFSREPRRAEQLLDRAVAAYPQWARPLQERARLYKSSGFLNDALEDLDAAKRLEPDNYWISVDRGLVLMDMNRKPDALEEFNRATEIDPNAFMAYVYTAGLKDELGDYEGAERDYVKLGRLRPEYYFAFEGLGLLKMKNKQWAQARDAFLEAYKQAPREYSYALLASVNWMRAGRQTDPKQFLAQVLRTAPRDSVEYAMLRLYHDLSGDLDVAVKVENEKNIYKKAQMLFYLASYYDIKGNTNLANRYYVMMQELNAMGIVEWRLNEWILEERKLGIRAGE